MALTSQRSYESLAHAAARTGMSIKTLRRRIAGGQLAAYRSGRLIRVDTEDVDRLLVRIPTMGSPIAPPPRGMPVVDVGRGQRF
ncbi:MAG: helix-turn-helix domain-containing protein [Micrococcales bacterium]|nr:helix-turn-helix domain-containing protein [Micrococcales bacterium]